MGRRVSVKLLLALLLVSVFVVGVETFPVKASETIYIRADGSIDPPTAPIDTVDNVTYTLTNNINDSIVVERSHIVIDGAGFYIQGDGYIGIGFTLQYVVNVTIKNVEVKSFGYGIYLHHSRDNTIYGNNITNNKESVYLGYSSNNTVSQNNITNNMYGVYLIDSSDNTISENSMTNYLHAC